MYTDLNFKKNFKFDQGDIVLLKEGYFQVLGPPQQPVLQPDKVVLLRIKAHDTDLTMLTKEELDNPSDVAILTKLELIAQLLGVQPTELVEILYA